MKKYLLLILLILTIGCTNNYESEEWIPFNNGLIFNVQELENDEEIAANLMVQYLELAKSGKIATGAWHDGRRWVNEYHPIVDFRIHEIEIRPNDDNQFIFSVYYDVKPLNWHNSDWKAGNGRIDHENEWVTSKFSFMVFEITNEGYKFIELASHI